MSLNKYTEDESTLSLTNEIGIIILAFQIKKVKLVDKSFAQIREHDVGYR